MTAWWQVDAYHSAKIFNDGPDDHGDRVPGGVGGRVEDGDVSETYDAGDAGAEVVISIFCEEVDGSSYQLTRNPM